MKRIILFFYFILVLSGLPALHAISQATDTNQYQLAVYYFPNYHIDTINERWHVKRWTEWDLVKNAQPKIPLEAFESALIKAKAFIDRRYYKNKIIILNAWNEWTEGSYLLPEERTGTKYLEAIKHVFSSE